MYLTHNNVWVYYERPFVNLENREIMDKDILMEDEAERTLEGLQKNKDVLVILKNRIYHAVCIKFTDDNFLLTTHLLYQTNGSVVRYATNAKTDAQRVVLSYWEVENELKMVKELIQLQAQ